MVKFGTQLERYKLPEWSDQYLAYGTLKERLKVIGKAKDAGDPEADAQVAEWDKDVKTAAKRIGDFVHTGMHSLERQFKELSKMAKDLEAARRKTQAAMEAATPSGRHSSDDPHGHEREQEDSDQKVLELRLLDSVGLIGDGAHRLKGFAEVNHAALYKILKYHDKVFHVQYGVETLFPDLLERTGIADEERFEDLDERLKKLTASCGETSGLEASPAVVRIVTGLGQHTPEGDRRNIERDHVLYFTLGALCAMMFSVCVLILSPVQQPETFRLSYFLSSFPAFRLVLSITLILWGAGFVIFQCDGHAINWVFLISVDPRCRLRARSFFVAAAYLNIMWMIIFVLYVVDYKWQVLPVDTDRSSKRFEVYPLVLIGIVVVGIVFPSQVCSWTDKGMIVASLWRTAVAPFYAVSFADNILGDILTSTAKPLQDIALTICEVQSGQQAKLHMEPGQTDQCPHWVHMVVLPCIAAAPYWFRAWQCFRRFLDTKGDPKHLCNLGKYLACLSVVVVSTVLGHKSNLVICVSVFASSYALTWDITMDWGLDRNVFFGSRLPKCLQKAKEGGGDERHGSMGSMGSMGSGLPEASRPLLDPSGTKSLGVRSKPVLYAARKSVVSQISVESVEGPAAPRRVFSRSVYITATFADACLRATWTTTLMPTSLVFGQYLNNALMPALIAGLEIFRRSMWSVLRIEYEQLSNAGGFRALYWVPALMSQEIQDKKEKKRRHHRQAKKTEMRKLSEGSEPAQEPKGARPQWIADDAIRLNVTEPGAPADEAQDGFVDPDDHLQLKRKE